MRLSSLVPFLATFLAPAFLVAEEQPVTTTPPRTTPALASSTDSSDTSVVVTADRRETDAARSTASVSRVEASDDRERGYVLNTWQWLEGLAGIDAVSGYGGIDGGIGRVRLRGSNSYDTQWMVDGIPVSDPSTPQGSVQTSHLPTAGLEAVEVVRGAQSGLYGSRAVGGVVNLITARPTAEHDTLARVEAGSFGTVRGIAQGTGPIANGLGYALAVDGLHSDGFSAKAAAGDDGDAKNHEADSIDRLGANGRLEWQVHPSTSLYVASRYQALNQEFDNNGPDDNLSFAQTRIVGFSGGTRSRISERLTIDTDLSWLASERHYRDNSSFFGLTTTDYTGGQQRASIQGRYQATTWVEIALGGDGAKESLTVKNASGTSIDESDWLGGAWAQIYSAGDYHDLSLSARQDLHSRAADATTWRTAAAGHLLDRRITVRGAVATAFRAPSLYEQFDPNPFTPGNPELEAQESLSYEVGLRLIPIPEITAESTWFVTDYDNVITTIATGVFTNVPSYKVRGWENSLAWSLWDRHLTLSGVYTWHDVVTVPDPTVAFDSFSPYQPRHAFDLSAVGRAELGWVRIGFTRRGAAPTTFGTYIDWASVVNAAAGMALSKNWEISVRVDNVFDEDYEVTPGYSTSGLAAYGGVAARF